MICKKASQKLNALSRLCGILPFHRWKMLMQFFFRSQFCYCPLVWMFHNRKINNRINNLHYCALRISYLDETSSFEKDLQFLATEMFKVTSNLAPDFMKEVFGQNTNVLTENISANTHLKPTFYNHKNPKKVNSGLETVRCLGPEIWSMVPDNVKNIILKTEIKKWTPVHCPCYARITFLN